MVINLAKFRNYLVSKCASNDFGNGIARGGTKGKPVLQTIEKFKMDGNVYGELRDLPNSCKRLDLTQTQSNLME